MIKLLNPRLAEAGKIKIGGKGKAYTDKSGRQRRMPDRFSYFQITTTEREDPTDLESPFREDTELMGALQREDYADQDGRIRRLPISVFSDELEEIFATALVSYHGAQLYCRGDGEEATRWEIKAGAHTGETKQIGCPCDRLKARQCKFTGILHCEIRLPGLAVAGSIYKWRTGSRISCEQMIGSLQNILARAGTLVGMPLLLMIRPVRVAPPGKSPMTVYVCHVDLREDILIAQRRALEFHRTRAELAGDLADAHKSYMRTILELPGTEAAEDQADIAAEFYGDETLEAEVLEAEPLPPEAAERLKTGPQAPPEDPPEDAITLDGRSHGLAPEEPPPAPPSKPAAPPPPPPAGDPGSCGEDPAGKGRRSRCKKGGGLYYADSLVKGVCPSCRGETAPAPPAPDPAPEIGSGPPAPPPREAAKCEQCGRDCYADELQVGICGFCLKGTGTEAPPEPNGDPAALRKQFADQLMADVKSNAYDPVKVLEEHRREWPELAKADHKGDYSLWTPEILQLNLAMLDRHAGRNQ